MREREYPGTELELFSQARNWKSYLHSILKDYLHGKVLEVGAGIGGTTSFLCDGSQQMWLCLEPDGRMAAILQSKIREGALPSCCSVTQGFISTLAKMPRFDAILYVDVLEHLADDREELEQAVKRLRPGGNLIVVAPAYMGLYSPFDSQIGHFRRYTKESLTALTPVRLELNDFRYLDSIGVFCSLGNRLLLHSRKPTPAQILFWDKVLVPCSRFLDPLLDYALGRSLVAVWSHSGS